MKRTFAIFLFVIMLLNLIVLSACKPEEKPVEEGITYSTLYHNEPQKSEPISGASVYKASYGYTLMQQQGYNGFTYEYGQSGQYTEMTHDGDKWTGGGATMKDALMQSTDSTSAVRAFTVPVSGRARVYGNPYLTDGVSATVTIYKGEQMLWQGSVNDETGLYQSEELDLAQGEVLRFEVSGQGTVYWNPTIDFTMAEEVLLHHTADGFYGDVHPFYDEKTGKLYMYYLSTGKQSGVVTEQFGSLLTVSDNFIQYNDVELKVDPVNPPEQDLYFALGVYVDKDGRYRSSYGKGNYAGGSVSDDLIVWKNGAEPYIDEADGLLKYTYRAYFDTGVVSGRDPDITYDKQSGKYYCIVMNYYSQAVANGEKGLALYTASEDGKFSTSAVRLVDFTGRGDPECPQLKKIGNRWYLFYSVYGTGTAGNVGNLSYRIGDEGVAPENVNWNEKEEYALEGGDLHAAQLCQVGDMFYMFGWLNYAPHVNVWGGYLNLAREVFQRADGTLGTRCDEYLSKLLNMGRVAQFDYSNTQPMSMDVVGTTFTSTSSTASASLNGSYGRSYLNLKIDLPTSAQYAGFSVMQGNTKYYVQLVRNNGELYLAITTNPGDLANGCKIKILDPSTTTFDMQVVLDGNFIEAYVNGEYSLSSNTHLTANGYNLGLIAGGTGVKLQDAEVCKLADYNNIFD